MSWLVLDVSSAPLPDADKYLEGAVRAPKNYKDESAIAAYITEKTAERLQMAATDVDLARLTGVGTLGIHDVETRIQLLRDEADEREALLWLAALVPYGSGVSIITFGGFNFDLPLIQRRAKYLGVKFPVINLDRFRSPHHDLCEELSDRNPQRRRSLWFYAKRLGWTDISKPLSGEEEAQVPVTGKWDELAASLTHDVTATYRLAVWMGLIQEKSA